MPGISLPGLVPNPPIRYLVSPQRELTRYGDASNPHHVPLPTPVLHPDTVSSYEVAPHDDRPWKGVHNGEGFFYNELLSDRERKLDNSIIEKRFPSALPWQIDMDATGEFDERGANDGGLCVAVQVSALCPSLTGYSHLKKRRSFPILDRPKWSVKVGNPAPFFQIWGRYGTKNGCLEMQADKPGPRTYLFCVNRIGRGRTRSATSRGEANPKLIYVIFISNNLVSKTIQ